jgi:hypothetical protein
MKNKLIKLVGFEAEAFEGVLIWFKTPKFGYQKSKSKIYFLQNKLDKLSLDFKKLINGQFFIYSTPIFWHWHLS